MGWHQSLELGLEAYGWLQPTHMGLGDFIPSPWWWRCSWFSKRDAVLDVLDYACNWFFLLCSSSVCAFMLWCFVLASGFCIWCWIHNSLNIWDHQLPHTHSCPSTSSPHLVVQCQVKSRIWRGKHGMVGWSDHGLKKQLYWRTELHCHEILKTWDTAASIASESKSPDKINMLQAYRHGMLKRTYRADYNGKHREGSFCLWRRWGADHNL
jgi:hypothetical protein